MAVSTKQTSPNPWTLARLESLIGTQESDRLDFKSSIGLRDPKTRQRFIEDLTAHVSAFLNTYGGTLVIGMEEDKRNGLADTAADLSKPGITESEMTASRLSDQICDRIHPSVAGRVQVFPVTVGNQSETGYPLRAFIIEVTEGVTAYQAADKLYYARRSFSSVPMDDKDIRLLMLSDDKPRGEVSFDLETRPAGHNWESAIRDAAAYRQFLASRTTPITPESAIEALQRRPNQPNHIEVEISLLLHNTGIATIHGGALSWRTDGELAPSLTFTQYSDSPMAWTPYGGIPLYPEMIGSIARWTLLVPTDTKQVSGDMTLNISTYLDGGLPARKVFELAPYLNQAIDEFHQRYQREVLGADISADQT